VTIDFNGLFRRYAEDLLRFTRRRVSSPDVAADVVQEAFARILRHPEPRDVRDPRAYLFTTAANLALDHRRHEGIARVDEDGDAALREMADPTADPERAAAARQELLLIRRAFDRLPERTRLVFGMHRMEGMSQPEIARALGISTTLVWRMVHEAYDAMRDALRESGEDGETRGPADD
jgi:RNA polymerase sigma factor (sigma-70 family)